MSARPAFRSGNPTLSDETFRRVRGLPGEEAMTLGGAVNKTALALILTLTAAAVTWNLGATDPRTGLAVIGGAIGGFIVAIATTFRPQWSPITAPIYAVLEGLMLGGISVNVDARYADQGLVGQAVFLTFGTLGGLLLAYRSGLVRATENFKLGVFAATGGIMLVYLVGFVMSFFGAQIPLIHGSGMVGIGFSLLVVAVAALNLVLDFDFIESGVARGAPRYMEWYAAFALLVTLVWLYLEMLRLLTKLQDRR